MLDESSIKDELNQSMKIWEDTSNSVVDNSGNQNNLQGEVEEALFDQKQKQNKEI